MKKTTIAIVCLLVAAIYAVFLLVTYNQEVTVVNLTRTITETSDIDRRDCLVTAETSDGQYVKAYAEAEACTYLQIGDRVKFEDGFLR